MNNLLTFALEAHGGLKAWSSLQSLRANVSIGGALWNQKQLPGLFENTRVELKLSYQDVVTHLLDLGERIVFTPHQVSLESDSGNTLDTCNDPRSRFSRHSANRKWDKLHAGYFSGYALWGYLTTPFLYTYPASMCKRLSPGMRTRSVGAFCRSHFLTNTRRTLARNTPTLARTGFSEDISTPSMF